ncbi:MAG: hypothetical protein ACI9TV_000950 [Sulfurimonas sp.]|jgi:hypothetical protein|uniref:hypothetical protein n=1 Tax=Sulfurimonas sp. TaxID=2022749 RepID=UPI0039E5B1F6
MNRVQKILLFVVGFIVTGSSVEATSIFARQYDMKCSGCHVGGVPPMMNSTGMQFLRNGLRFSKSDVTTLKKALDGEVIPVGFFIGAGVKDASLIAQVKNPKTGKPMTIKQDGKPENLISNLFLSGSLTEELSGFMGGKFAYTKDKVTGNRSVELLGSKVYLQYNINEAQHVVRAGVISPYTQFGNVSKASENAGVDDVPNFFSSPISMANKISIYGLDYTYLTDDGIMFLVAGGVLENTNDESNIVLGVNYDNGKNFKIGAILNSIKDTVSAQERSTYLPSEAILGERTTLMVPVEYYFGQGYFNTAVVYSTDAADRSGNTTKDYYGSESALTIPLFEAAKVRLVYTTDNNSGKSYAFSYSQLFFDSVMLGANVAKVKTDKAEFDSMSASVYYIF